MVSKDGVAERRFITLSHAIGNDWYVTDGLELGEKIVLNGVHNVRSGMKVQEISEEQMKAEQESGGAE